MSDNPRVPGHPSDVPSSRASGRITDSPASSLNTGLATPIPSTPVSSPGKTPRNIIIGAIVTIITSTTVFYLTQYLNKKSDGNDFLRTKEATTAAWKSYVAYQNAYTENTLSFEKDILARGYDVYLIGMKKESAKFQKDVKDLANTQNIDKDLAKALNRSIENQNDLIPEAEKYIKTVKQIFTSKKSLEEIRQNFIDEEIKRIVYSKGTFERSVNDVKEIAKTLSERYGQSFSMNDFTIVQIFPQKMKTEDSLLNVLRNGPHFADTSHIIYATHVDPKALIGNWEGNGDTILLKKDNTMIFKLSTGYKATGTWAIENKELRLNEFGTDGKEKFISFFKLSDITANSFTATRDQFPFDTYSVVRAK
jgi:hypothetical protein